MTDETELYSGNKATDFQPTTRDPQQGNVDGNLQPVSGGLQPVSGTGNASQQLPRVPNLTVETTGQARTTQAPASSSQNEPFPLAFSVGIGLILLFFVLMIWLASPIVKEDMAVAVPEDTPPAPVKKPKKSKSKKKKSSKRKSS